MAGRPNLVACTPAGVMEIFRRSNIPLEGANAVVMGRSDIVGKRMAILLMHAHATVTICHSKTRQLQARTGHPRLRRYVAEGPIAVIVKQMVPGRRHHYVQNRMAIVVVIPYGDGRAEEGDKFLPAEFQRVVRGFDRLMRIRRSRRP